MILHLPFFAHAEWRIGSSVDSMTDKQTKMATTTNSTGHRLSIYRSPSGAVYGLFSLPETNAEILDSRLPMYRVDKLEVVDMDSAKSAASIVERSGGGRLFVSKPKWLNFLVYHGEGEPKTGHLRDIMDGKAMIIRYWLLSGGHRETTFDLIGAKQAIAAALSKDDISLSPPIKAAATPSAVSQGTSKTALEVSNIMVKRVKVPGTFFGENIVFRYFFLVENKSKVPFTGQVRIQLINKTTGTNGTAEGTFKCEIVGEGAANSYFDASTGPERFHGEYSIVGYLYEVKVGEDVVAKGKFALTDRFEDTTK
ncbi:MAG: hypothetical protein IPK32_24565 [Verrucomicrobiaceae bacterium]|nr:hypothetical protein [Verrucomicrobiaceae bacterium]